MWNRTSGWAARSAALRSARRRAGAFPKRDPRPAAREPLPPLVSPDDDREFVEPRARPALERTGA